MSLSVPYPPSGRAIKIGLLDSGSSPEYSHRVEARLRFALDSQGTVTEYPALPDGSGHGSAVGRIIAALAPTARLLDAQVLDSHGTSTPAAVAAALGWLDGQGARLVNMSFGLVEDREVLRRACERAQEAGIVIFAAAPARGPRVFPAAYPGVISVAADGRCAHDEVSMLRGEPADFGACPRPLVRRGDARAAGGGSYAVAHVTGIVGAWMAAQGEADAGEVYRYLGRIARHVTKAALRKERQQVRR